MDFQTQSQPQMSNQPQYSQMPEPQNKNKKMIILLIVIAVIIIIAGFGAWWYLLRSKELPSVPYLKPVVTPSAQAPQEGAMNQGASLSDIEQNLNILPAEDGSLNQELDQLGKDINNF